MIYITSGFMRCGTSMMMECLEAGGMTVAYSKDRNIRMNRVLGDEDLPKPYFPNDNYYELDRSDYRNPEFPHQYEGKLVKCLWGGMVRLQPKKENTEGYRIVFMRRPRENIVTSMIAAFGYSHPAVDNPHFDQYMDNIVNILKDRRSVVSLDEVQYSDVLRDPLGVFQKLQSNGWPIDPVKAASIPNKNKARFTT